MPPSTPAWLLAIAIGLGAAHHVVVAQVQPEPALVEALPPDQASALTLANRPIIVFRARVLTQGPADRTTSAHRELNDMVESNIDGPVVVGRAGPLRYLQVGNRAVFEMVADDRDPASSQTLDELAEATAAALRVALAEAIEARNPGRLTEAAVRVLVATLIFIAGMFVLWWVHRRARRGLSRWTDRHLGETLDRFAVSEQVTLFVRFLRAIVALGALAFALLLANAWLSYALAQFPYTRPLGNSLRARLVELLGRMGMDLIQALPGLLVVAVIVIVTRALIRLTGAFLDQVEHGRTEVRWAHAETAAATRRMLTFVLWILAIVMAYPYLPGTSSDAFKGVSVFIGLVISLGSSGLVNQIMSGLSLTYSRALRVGDAVRVGDHEGIVTSMGLFSVKLLGAKGDEITVPNAVVVSQSMGNFTKLAPAGGSYLTTFVTIGYDAPWRQVEALLTLGAERTAGLLKDPPPRVLQDALEDFYVKYRLTVCLAAGVNRLATRKALLGNIQDAFNEFGVQIMSPNYEADPEAPKVVPRDRWYAGPATPQNPEEPGSRLTLVRRRRTPHHREHHERQDDDGADADVEHRAAGALLIGRPGVTGVVAAAADDGDAVPAQASAAQRRARCRRCRGC